MSGRLIVVKVGGGLSATPGALEAVGRALAQAGQRHRLLVVPGGGPFADAVRAFDQREGLSADAAHWMAILAMDQYAYVLVERIPGSVLVEEPGAIGAALGRAGVAVLAPSRWLRAADVLPHAWAATSDSAAAFVAGALDAERLVLIKPASSERAADVVDPHFALVLPVGLPWSALGWREVGELGKLLDG
jgi:5-(aminomethyl)-3-furanmethanol phosphate kinase